MSVRMCVCGSMSVCVVIIDGETLLTEVNGSSRQEAEPQRLSC